MWLLSMYIYVIRKQLFFILVLLNAMNVNRNLPEPFDFKDYNIAEKRYFRGESLNPEQHFTRDGIEDQMSMLLLSPLMKYSCQNTASLSTQLQFSLLPASVFDNDAL